MTFMKLRWFIAQRAAVASVSSNAVHQAWWSQEEKITCSLKFFWQPDEDSPGQQLLLWQLHDFTFTSVFKSLITSSPESLAEQAWQFLIQRWHVKEEEEKKEEMANNSLAWTPTPTCYVCCLGWSFAEKFLNVDILSWCSLPQLNNYQVFGTFQKKTGFSWLGKLSLLSWLHWPSWHALSCPLATGTWSPSHK